MKYKLIYWLITKILWRPHTEPEIDDIKIEYGWKLFNYFTPYPEYKGLDWSIRPQRVKKFGVAWLKKRGVPILADNKLNQNTK